MAGLLPETEITTQWSWEAHSWHKEDTNVAFKRSQQPCFPKPYVAMPSAAYNLGKLRTWQGIGILEHYLFLWFPGETTGWLWKLRREWVSWRHQKCLPQFWMAFSRGAKGPPDTISSTSTS